MTRPPFGFGPSGRPEEPEEPGDDPFGLGALLGGMGGGGDLGGMFAQLQKLMSWSGGPVNWDLATEVATTATRQQDRPVTAAETAEVVEACRLADLWLDGVTGLPAVGGTAQAWTRTGWVEDTLPAWRQLVDPVAGRVVDAMTGTLEKGLTDTLSGEGGLPEGLPPELAGLLGGGAGGLAGALGPLSGVMKQVGGFAFGAQVGQALGALAAEVLSGGEIGLPLARSGRPALLPANVAAFTDGLAVEADQARLYLALRETAHARLFHAVPWLQAHLFDTVDAYARGIEVDPGAIERAVGSLDPSDPESLQRAIGEGLFDIPPTEAQAAALARLETALALVEGWIDAVVDAAARGHLPSAAALRETVRRRRATGGPAEQTFAALVGLQLRPRRLRDAAALWAALAHSGGAEARDALWAHPDLLPSAEDLDDPVGFAARAAGGSTADEESGVDWDAGLRDLDKDLDGSLDEDATGGPDEPPAPS